MSQIYFKDVDMGYRQIIEDIKGLAGLEVAAGLLTSEKGDTHHPYSKVLLSEYASVNEFGSEDGKVPERSFLRKTFEEKWKLWFEIVFTGIGIKGRNPAEALTRVGEFMSRDIKTTIEDMREPRNSKFTIRVKGFDNPLIWTHLLYDSIDFRVGPPIANG